LERWAQATAALKAFAAHYPDFISAHAWLAIDYFNLHEHDLARGETAQTERLASLSRSANGYAALAAALNAQGKPVEALVAIGKGMRFDPHNPSMLGSQGWAYAQLGQWEQSLSAWKRYSNRYPDDLGARASLASLYSSLGRMDAAGREAEHLDSAVARDPDTAYGQRYLAMALNAAGRPADALAAAEKGMTLYPFTGPFPPFPECEQSQAYTQLGRWPEAVRPAQACVARHPLEQISAHIDLAVDYIELGQDDAARAEVRDILKLDPEFSLKRALDIEFPAQRDRAADLRKAGLK
jgi:tetratricopeptide (TPR) repeat protein